MKRALSRKNLWENAPRWVRSVAGTALSFVPPGLLLGGDFRRRLGFVEEADRWPAERARAYQLEELKRICTLAERTPFYREAFGKAGFDPRDLKSIDDLSGLPLIDRETLRTHLDAMCAVPPDGGGIDMVSTGGTSGMPLRFYIGAGRSAVEYAYLVAGWKRVGYRLTLPQAILRGQVVEPDRNGLRHEYDAILRRHYYSNFHTSDVDVARYLGHIATIGPCFLHVYPSSVLALARFLERTRRRVPRNIRGILAGSEIVYPEDRARVERVFSLRYYSWYGHSEKLVMAAECEKSADYHVFPTYGLCELVDEQGRPVRTPGQRGEIVGTGFMNTVVPFIRYRTGDQATYVGDRCPSCGRAQMLLSEIRGHRTQEMLVARDGALISWTAVNMHDDTFDGVRQFQFLQEKPGHATLRLVAADGFGEVDQERIQRNLMRKLEGRMTFDVKIVDEIPLTRSGKSTYVEQHVDLSTAAADLTREG